MQNGRFNSGSGSIWTSAPSDARIIAAMTFEEALNKLALPADTSAQEARRVYHKLLKVHKPELDRDAFIALREAYDCVRITLALRAHQGEPLPATAALEPETPSGSVSATEVPTSMAEAPRSTPASEELEPLAGDRFSKLLGERNYEGAAAILCEAFDRFADQPTILRPVLVTLQLMLACHANNKVAAASIISRRRICFMTGRVASIRAPSRGRWRPA